MSSVRRTVMMFTQNNVFVGRLDNHTPSRLDDVCICSFVVGNTHQGPAQIAILRKAGTIRCIPDNALMIDLMDDTDIYRSYSEVMAGIR